MSIARIYLAGPMTGHLNFNYPAFNAEAARLRALGLMVENPAQNPKQASWNDYMRVGIRQMLTCTHVALLPGWESSHGACLERSLAITLGIPVQLSSQYQATIADPDCWFCEGTGKYKGDPCLICLEPQP